MYTRLPFINTLWAHTHILPLTPTSACSILLYCRNKYQHMPMHIFKNTAADFRSGLASNKHAEITTCSGFLSGEQLTFLTEEETCDTVLEWIRLWFSAASDCSSLFPRRHQWGCTWWVNMSGLHTQRMHEHTPTRPCTSMHLTWETLGKSPGFWHHTRRDLLTMARGDWGTENRTRSVISSCAGIQNPIFLTQMCKNTQTQTNTHSHLGQGWTRSVAEVSNIETAQFFSFCNHFCNKAWHSITLYRKRMSAIPEDS